MYSVLCLYSYGTATHTKGARAPSWSGSTQGHFHNGIGIFLVEIVITSCLAFSAILVICVVAVVEMSLVHRPIKVFYVIVMINLGGTVRT